ncbi:MAG: hypothetical protein ABSG73_11090 [Candidatus Aminicenantales bacterium]|jgi:lipid II:glycine glycyltransferase (peptidoglycan interpeptide bridge formation enzyme)
MTNERKYYCWGDDHEDLTKKVEDAKPPDTTVITFRTISSDSVKAKTPHKWRVEVKCCKGHENIFEGED